MIAKINYHELNFELHAAQAGVEAAECHGFLVGCFCACNFFEQVIWKEYLLTGDTSNVEAQLAILSPLAEQIAAEVTAEDIAFNLLLPDDDTPIAERSKALTLWCAGFIGGLNLADANGKKNHEDGEFIKDLILISRLDTQIEDSEEAELNLFNLIEYIRVGVLILYQEQNKDDSAKADRVIH